MLLFSAFQQLEICKQTWELTTSWSWLHDLTASWLHTSFSASCLTCVRFFLGFGFFKWTVMLEVAKCISTTNYAKNRKCVSFTQQLQIQKSLDLKNHWVIGLFSSSAFWPVVNCTGFQLFRRSKLDCCQSSRVDIFTKTSLQSHWRAAKKPQTHD